MIWHVLRFENSDNNTSINKIQLTRFQFNSQTTIFTIT